MKVRLSISRQDLADKNYGETNKEIIEEAELLPDEARLIAEAINQILLKEDITNV